MPFIERNKPDDFDEWANRVGSLTRRVIIPLGIVALTILIAWAIGTLIGG